MCMCIFKHNTNHDDMQQMTYMFGLLAVGKMPVLRKQFTRS